MKMEPVITVKDSVTVRKEIISRWQELWRDFLQNTSLHGCKNMCCHKRHKINRIVWTMLLLAMTGVCLKTLAGLYSRYYSYNFTTTITRERKQQIRFPSITICNRNMFDISQENLSDTQLKYLRLSGDLGDMCLPIDWDGEEGRELSAMDCVEFWERGAYKQEELFKITYFNGKRFHATSLKNSQKQNQLCFTFNGGRFVTENTGLTLLIDIKQGTYLDGATYEAGVSVFIDEPDTAPSFSEDAMTGVSVGTSTRLKMTKKEMKYLPDPYNTRGTDCVDTKASDFVNPLEWFKVYSFDGCLQECSNKAAMDACNCTAGWEPQQARVDLRHCSVKELHTCYRPKNNQEHLEARMGKRCACWYPCEETTYDIQMSSMALPSNVTSLSHLAHATLSPDVIRQNILILQIMLSNMVVDRAEHKPDLELGDIFAKVGGQIGLFLGASILTTVELLELLAACLVASLTSLWAIRKLKG